jgi:UDPglucose--hexose-1-phosphate uridylyltransferase
MTWEQRWHPLREEWVIVAAHRQSRPWTGGTVKTAAAERRTYEADCYLCPGNARVGGVRNPRYDGTFVFDNDHPCVGPAAPREPAAPPAPYRLKYLAGPEIGGGNFLSDTSPEASAAELRALPAVHHAAPPPGIAAR